MFDFLKGNKITTKDKEEIAKLLSTNPKALEDFEKAYSINALSPEEIPENFFEVNSRQAVAMNTNREVKESPQLNDIKNRIVNELLQKCSTWKFDGHSVSINNNLGTTIESPVTNEEINGLPENMRPQLTGNLMKTDMKEPSYIILLENYKNFLKEKNPKNRELFYHLFRQGLDILDLDEITRRIIATNKNSMGFWLPQIIEPALTGGGN